MDTAAVGSERLRSRARSRRRSRPEAQKHRPAGPLGQRSAPKYCHDLQWLSALGATPRASARSGGKVRARTTLVAQSFGDRLGVAVHMTEGSLTLEMIQQARTRLSGRVPATPCRRSLG